MSGFYDETLQDLVLLLREPEREAALRYLKTVRLAGGAERFLAFADDESVPLYWLDPFWVERYGLRDAA